jgi:hypothetical protein
MVPSSTRSSPLSTLFGTFLRALLLVASLWLGLLHLPGPFSIEIFDAPSVTLDYAVRHGFGLGTDLPSASGPLGALLTPVHSGQPLWLNYWCQSLVALVFALGLAWTVWRSASPARWWLLGSLLIVAGFRAEYLYLTLLILGGMMLIAQPVRWFEAAGIGFVLGLLSLIHVQFAWLAVGAVLLAAVNPAPGHARLVSLAAGGMIPAVVLIGWAWCGQPISDLLPWLARGFPPTGLRYQAAADSWPPVVVACGLLAFIALLLLLAGATRTATKRRTALALAAFVLGVLTLVWCNATGQPGYDPQPFFASALAAGIGWLALARTISPLRWLDAIAGSTIALATLGLLAVEPRIVTESIILLNQKMVANATALADRKGWQRGHNDAFRSAGKLFALPRIKAAIGDRRTDLLGNALGYALVNQMNYAPRPGVQGYRVTEAGLAARDAAYYGGPSAPEFVVQRLQAFDRGLAAMEDAPAQLALYYRYEFLFEESGFALWQKRNAGGPPVQLDQPLWQAKAAWDQAVALPVRDGHAYWVKIQVSRSAAGWLQSRLLFPGDPTLVLHDAEGGALSYRASPSALATGFLLNPLFRGEIDVVRHQAGETLPVIRELTLQKPAGREADFDDQVEISLYEVPVPAVSGRKDSSENLAARFRISNRLPVAISAYFPPQTARIEQQEVLLAHPDCSLEFPVRSGDRGLRGRFGLLDNAYRNGNATDGVEFVVEYIPARGPATVLWRRALDPVNQTGDRGLQSFSVAFPQPASGRVILRTQNQPGHNAAWDWSLWSDLRFEPAPATK